MKILFTVGKGILFVNPYGSEKKGPYLPVGMLSENMQTNLARIIKEVADELQTRENNENQK
jgi:hypothetical protein